jgi:hypothetical protein
MSSPVHIVVIYSTEISSLYFCSWCMCWASTLWFLSQHSLHAPGKWTNSVTTAGRRRICPSYCIRVLTSNRSRVLLPWTSNRRLLLMISCLCSERPLFLLMGLPTCTFTKLYPIWKKNRCMYGIVVALSPEPLCTSYFSRRPSIPSSICCLAYGTAKTDQIPFSFTRLPFPITNRDRIWPSSTLHVFFPASFLHYFLLKKPSVKHGTGSKHVTHNAHSQRTRLHTHTDSLFFYRRVKKERQTTTEVPWAPLVFQ